MTRLKRRLRRGVDDIDEAIVSRCIAMIRYSPPNSEDRLRIWQVMTEQFGLQVEATTITELVVTFPQATGREIKGLVKLVTKFCAQKQLSPTLAMFKRCSVFRGMELQQPTP